MLLRPTRGFVTAVSVALAILAVLVGGFVLLLVEYRFPEGIVFAGVDVGLIYLLLRIRQMKIVADERWVTVVDLLHSGRGRREDIAAIRLRAGFRAALMYSFVGRDGGEAFWANARAWRQSDIRDLAGKLGVPLQLTSADARPRYHCPVCGYTGLDEPPQRDGAPSHEICPSCGFEFGETDGVEGKSYATWREQWIDSGMPWFAAQAGEKPPQGWDPAGQVRSLPRRS